MCPLDPFDLSTLKQVISTGPTTTRNTSTTTGFKVMGKTTFVKVNEELISKRELL